jgi:hypothetical protein
MSRYSLKPLPHRGDLFEVAVGWDAGLGTYFAVVFGVPESNSDPAIISWQGRLPGQLPTVSELVSAVRDCAEVSPELLQNLATDKRASQPGLERQLSSIISALLS